MKLTDLIIKRFYQDLKQDMESRNSAVAGFDDIDDLDLDITLALEDIDTSDRDLFSRTCERTLRLGETCALDSKELAILLSEMKYAALERLPDYDEAIEAIEVINGLEEACCHE